MWSITTWLIVINVAVHIVNSMVLVTVTSGGRQETFRLLSALGHFSVATAIQDAQVWRFITFQFLHADLWHLLMNMFGLYFFGPLIENYLGPRRYLAFYLLCGIAGPVGYMILWATGDITTLAMTAHVPLIGASAGVFGILIAAAHIAPETIVLVYGIIPMRLKVMAWLLLAIAVYITFTSGHNAGGEAAHLGGAVLGWLLIRNPNWLNVFLFSPKHKKRVNHNWNDSSRW